MEKFNFNNEKPKNNKIKNILKIGGLATLLAFTPKESVSQNVDKDISNQKDSSSYQKITKTEMLNFTEEKAKQEMYKIQIPEDLKKYFTDEKGELRPDWYHVYTEIIYAQKIYTDENGDSVEGDDFTKVEGFFTFDDKIKKIEQLLNIKLDKKKILEKIQTSGYLADLFSPDYHSIPTRPRKESKISTRDGNVDIISAKTEKELLTESHEFELAKKDGFPENFLAP